MTKDPTESILDDGAATAQQGLAGKKRQAILVVGMHRSGTSAATRMMNLLGCKLPENLLEANSGNELGHWEPALSPVLHEAMLVSAGSRWDSVFGVEPAWFQSSAAKHYSNEVCKFIQSNFDCAPLFVVKDPRIALLVPIWLDALRHLDIEPKFVIPFRHPFEVEASLDARDLNRDGGDKWSEGQGKLLWLRYVLSAEKATRNWPRSFVNFEALLFDWKREAKRIASQLGIIWPRQSRATKLEIEEFLNCQYRHQSASVDFNWDGYGASFRSVFHQLKSCVDNPYEGIGTFEEAEHAFVEAKHLFGDYVEFLNLKKLSIIQRERSSNEKAHSELERLRRDTIAKVNAISYRDGLIAVRDQKLVVADGDLRRLSGAINERDRKLVAADGHLRGLMVAIEDREQKLTAADGDLRRLLDEIKDRDQKLVAADGHLRGLMVAIEDREQKLTAADGDLRRLLDEIKDRDQKLVAADGDLRRLMDEIKDRDQKLAAADGDLRRLSGESSDRDQKLMVADAGLRSLRAEIEGRDFHLRRFKDEISSVKEHLEERERRLKAIEQRLHDIETSTVWRVTAPIRKLFPNGTRSLSRSNE